MSKLQIETINILNDKGLRYKAEAVEGGLGFKFGMMLGGKKAIAIIQPNETEIVVQGLGEAKVLDESSFAGFVDKVLNIRSSQEALDKLEQEILA